MSRRRITVHPQRAHRLCRRYQDREGALAIRLLQLAALLQHLQRNGGRRHRKREPTDDGTAPAGEPMPPPSGRVGRPDAPCDRSIIPSCHHARLVVGGQPLWPTPRSGTVGRVGSTMFSMRAVLPDRAPIGAPQRAGEIALLSQPIALPTRPNWRTLTHGFRLKACTSKDAHWFGRNPCRDVASWLCW
jgi:hypothetical protein